MRVIIDDEVINSNDNNIILILGEHEVGPLLTSVEKGKRLIACGKDEVLVGMMADISNQMSTQDITRILERNIVRLQEEGLLDKDIPKEKEELNQMAQWEKIIVQNESKITPMKSYLDSILEKIDQFTDEDTNLCLIYLLYRVRDKRLGEIKAHELRANELIQHDKFLYENL